MAYFANMQLTPTVNVTILSKYISCQLHQTNSMSVKLSWVVADCFIGWRRFGVDEQTLVKTLLRLQQQININCCRSITQILQTRLESELKNTAIGMTIRDECYQTPHWLLETFTTNEAPAGWSLNTFNLLRLLMSQLVWGQMFESPRKKTNLCGWRFQFMRLDLCKCWILTLVSWSQIKRMVLDKMEETFGCWSLNKTEVVDLKPRQPFPTI